MWEYEDQSLPYGNQHPETYLSLIALDTIFAVVTDVIISEDSQTGEIISDTLWNYEFNEPLIDTSIIVDTLPHAFTTITTSRQELHWWGEDPDGDVTGYKYRWNTDSSWTETNDESAIFFVPIKKEFDVFQFEVKSVDNMGNIDQSPAKLVLPIYNSPPHINFRHLSNPLSIDLPEPKNIHYTFPTRTFIWDVTDLDGIETIISIYYALDDTCETCWYQLDAAAHSSVTLNALTSGEHTFYVKAQDIAGKFSSVIQFPDETDENTPNLWVVKEPNGSFLIVDDYSQDSPNNALNWYMGVMDSLEIDGYSYWEVGEKLPYSIGDITATLSFFDHVIWYAGYTGNYTYPEAEIGIQSFIERGGNFFLNFAVFPDTADISWFPLNQTFPLNPGGDIQSQKLLLPQVTGADTLKIGSPISVAVKGFNSYEEGYQSLYNLQEPEDSFDLWNGSPTVSASYQYPGIPNSGTAILMSLPLFKGYTPVLDLEWETVDQDFTSVLYAITYSDSEIIWAVGEDGMILKSSDSGKEWENIIGPTDRDLRGVAFANASTGWIVGKTGTILKTIDGGESWISQNSGTTRTLYSVTAISENTLWIAGKSGTLLHSMDGGEIWHQIDIENSSRLEDIWLSDSLTGWVVGSNGTILRTENGGESWEDIDSGLQEDLYPWFYGVHFNQTNMGWICGSDGTILKTNDGGINWEYQETPIVATLYDIFFLNESIGFSVGSGGNVLTTYDGGETWNSIYSGVGEDLRSLSMISSKKGIITGGNTQPFQKGVILQRSSSGNSGALFDFILNNLFNE